MLYADYDLYFLTKFKKPNSPNAFNKDVWLKILKRDILSAIKDFKQDKLLTNADTTDKICNKYMQDDLKDFCKKWDCNTTGSKVKLAEKLISKNPKYWSDQVKKVVLYKLTAQGKELVNSYIDSEKEKKTLAVKNYIDEINNKSYKKALLILGRWEASQFIPRGFGIDWDSYPSEQDLFMLDAIMTKTPKVLQNVNVDDINISRKYAVLEFFWDSSALKIMCPNEPILSNNIYKCAEIAHLLYSHAKFLQSKNECLKMQREEQLLQKWTLKISPFCSNNNCYRQDVFIPYDAPELPNKNCTLKGGCKCFYLLNIVK